MASRYEIMLKYNNILDYKIRNGEPLGQMDENHVWYNASDAREVYEQCVKDLDVISFSQEPTDKEISEAQEKFEKQFRVYTQLINSGAWETDNRLALFKAKFENVFGNGQKYGMIVDDKRIDFDSSTTTDLVNIFKHEDNISKLSDLFQKKALKDENYLKYYGTINKRSKAKVGLIKTKRVVKKALNWTFKENRVAKFVSKVIHKSTAYAIYDKIFNSNQMVNYLNGSAPIPNKYAAKAMERMASIIKDVIGEPTQNKEEVKKEAIGAAPEKKVEKIEIPKTNAESVVSKEQVNNTSPKTSVAKVNEVVLDPSFEAENQNSKSKVGDGKNPEGEQLSDAPNNSNENAKITTDVPKVDVPKNNVVEDPAINEYLEEETVEAESLDAKTPPTVEVFEGPREEIAVDPTIAGVKTEDENIVENENLDNPTVEATTEEFTLIETTAETKQFADPILAFMNDGYNFDESVQMVEMQHQDAIKGLESQKNKLELNQAAFKLATDENELSQVNEELAKIGQQLTAWANEGKRAHKDGLIRDPQEKYVIKSDHLKGYDLPTQSELKDAREKYNQLKDRAQELESYEKENFAEQIEKVEKEIKAHTEYIDKLNKYAYDAIEKGVNPKPTVFEPVIDKSLNEEPEVKVEPKVKVGEQPAPETPVGEEQPVQGAPSKLEMSAKAQKKFLKTHHTDFVNYYNDRLQNIMTSDNISPAQKQQLIADMKKTVEKDFIVDKMAKLEQKTKEIADHKKKAEKGIELAKENKKEFKEFKKSHKLKDMPGKSRREKLANLHAAYVDDHEKKIEEEVRILQEEDLAAAKRLEADKEAQKQREAETQKLREQEAKQQEELKKVDDFAKNNQDKYRAFRKLYLQQNKGKDASILDEKFIRDQFYQQNAPKPKRKVELRVTPAEFKAFANSHIQEWKNYRDKHKKDKSERTGRRVSQDEMMFKFFNDHPENNVNVGEVVEAPKETTHTLTPKEMENITEQNPNPGVITVDIPQKDQPQQKAEGQTKKVESVELDLGKLGEEEFKIFAASREKLQFEMFQNDKILGQIADPSERNGVILAKMAEFKKKLQADRESGKKIFVHPDVLEYIEQEKAIAEAKKNAPQLGEKDKEEIERLRQLDAEDQRMREELNNQLDKAAPKGERTSQNSNNQNKKKEQMLLETPTGIADLACDALWKDIYYQLSDVSNPNVMSGNQPIIGNVTMEILKAAAGEKTSITPDKQNQKIKEILENTYGNHAFGDLVNNPDKITEIAKKYGIDLSDKRYQTGIGQPNLHTIADAIGKKQCETVMEAKLSDQGLARLALYELSQAKFNQNARLDKDGKVQGALEDGNAKTDGRKESKFYKALVSCGIEFDVAVYDELIRESVERQVNKVYLTDPNKTIVSLDSENGPIEAVELEINGVKTYVTPTNPPRVIETGEISQEVPNPLVRIGSVITAVNMDRRLDKDEIKLNPEAKAINANSTMLTKDANTTRGDRAGVGAELDGMGR